MPEDRGLHGYVQNNPLANWLLQQGNKMRYGKSEVERMDMVNKLSAPGVKDYAYDERGIYDPAAAERYTSAYLGGQNWNPSEGVQRAFHSVSGGSRDLMHSLGVPGVHAERPELKAAEEAGMHMGASIPPMLPPSTTEEVRPGYGLAGAEIKPAEPDGLKDFLMRLFRR